MRIVAFACLASLITLPAMADRTPQPKPSGITIHLFGPDLVTTDNSPTSTSSNGSQAAAGSPQAAQPEPTMSQVLHEMFVTGDPAQDGKPQFPRGKQASQ